MARAAYFAPGVYVEELPSARQPIAGVGTNTVGFIGVVPNTIWYPVRSPNYDPVLAQTLMAYRQSSASSTTDDAAATMAARRAPLQSQVDALQAEVGPLQQASDAAATDVTTAEGELARVQGDAAAADAAKNRLSEAQHKAAEASEKLEPKKQDLENLKRDLALLDRQLGPAAAGSATGQQSGGTPARPRAGQAAAQPPEQPPSADPKQAPQFGETPQDYSPTGDPDPDLTYPSIFRPYYLQPFTVTAKEFDTKLCTNFSEYADRFGNFSAFRDNDPNEHDPEKKTFQPYHRGHHLLTHAVAGFFANGGTRCFVTRVNTGDWVKALDQFESIEDVSILAAPGLPKSKDIWDGLQTYCEADFHQNVFAILDSPLLVEDDHEFNIQKLSPDNRDALLPRKSAHAAYYFPHIEVMDPAKRLQDSDPAWGVAPKYWGRTYVAPSGHVAGIYARTDEERGVHKAPANATVRGALEVKYYISNRKQDLLNPHGVNCIRLMNGDVTVWGARNIGGDSLGEWKYVSVRRFAGFLEESISRGTQWVVFEPNDPNLWSRIILNITAFLTNVWRSGALFGLTPQEAFYVKCDAELNPPEVRDLGMVITEIGVAIVRPAEFVIFRITQSSGQQQG